MDTELTRLPGAPETELTPDMLAQLPAQAPPAPWDAAARGLIWWSRPDRAATEAIRDILPPDLRQATPLATVVMLVSYLDTPVGPYEEILALLALRTGRSIITHVPFIAVSSPASVVGGRANWSLPKTLATFTGQPEHNTAMSAQGHQWNVTATARRRGPALPFLLPALAPLVQTGPDGHNRASRPSFRGRGHLARITIEANSTSDLATWLPTGQHTGLLCPHISGHLTTTTPHH